MVICPCSLGGLSQLSSNRLKPSAEPSLGHRSCTAQPWATCFTWLTHWLLSELMPHCPFLSFSTCSCLARRLIVHCSYTSSPKPGKNTYLTATRTVSFLRVFFWHEWDFCPADGWGGGPDRVSSICDQCLWTLLPCILIQSCVPRESCILVYQIILHKQCTLSYPLLKISLSLTKKDIFFFSLVLRLIRCLSRTCQSSIIYLFHQIC